MVTRGTRWNPWRTLSFPRTHYPVQLYVGW